MPVKAKLSRKFYETFGDDIMNELVDWFNSRIAEVKADIGALESRIEARMARFEARIIRWMFLFWAGQAVTTVGLVFGVVRLTGR